MIENIWPSFYTSCRSINPQLHVYFPFQWNLKCPDLTFLVWAHMGHTTLWVVYGATSFVYNILCTSFTLVFFCCFSQLETCCSLCLNLFKVSFIDQSVLLFRLWLTTTGITKKLATPPYFFRDWNWQRLPGPMATDTKLFPRPNGYRCQIVSERMDQCPFGGCSNERSRETWEIHSPPMEKFPFCRFELRHCSWFWCLHIR